MSAKQHVMNLPNIFTGIKRHKPLSKAAKNIEAYIIYNIDTFNDDEFPKVTVTKRLLHQLGVSKSSLKREFEPVLKELQDYEIEFKNANGKRVNTRLCAGFTVIEEGEEYELGFHPALAPLLLQIKNQYTKISFELVLGVGEKSEYSYNLYTILKTEYDKIIYISRTKEKNPKVQIPCALQSLRDSLGVSDGKYPLPSEFARNVLKRASGEINEKTDIKIISYKPYKEGRKIMGYTFTVEGQLYQPEFTFNFNNQARIVNIEDDIEISERITEILERFTYKIHGEASTFIKEMILEYTEANVYHSLVDLYETAKEYPDKVKGGIVKNRLKDHVHIYQEKKTSEEQLAQLELDEKKKELAKAAYKKYLASEVDTFMLFNDDKVEEIRQDIISKNQSDLIDYESKWGKALLESLVQKDIEMIVQLDIGNEAAFIEQNMRSR